MLGEFSESIDMSDEDSFVADSVFEPDYEAEVVDSEDEEPETKVKKYTRQMKATCWKYISDQSETELSSEEVPQLNEL